MVQVSTYVLLFWIRDCAHVRCLDTLDAYTHKYSSMVPFLADNAKGSPPSDAAPAEQTSKAISLRVRPFSLITAFVYRPDLPSSAPDGRRYGLIR
jgi:hypothetical protein